MRNKLSIIFLLFGGIFIITGATFMSINNKYEDKKEDQVTKNEKKYMPILYKVEDKDSYVYILPNMPLGDSKITNIDDDIYDLLEDNKLVVQYDFSKLNQRDYISNFILDEDDYLDNYIDDALKEKLANFSNSHPKYNYDDYNHYNIGFNYNIIDNLAYYESDLTSDGFMNNLIEKYTSDKDNKLTVLETEEDRAYFINSPYDETYISMINELIDNFDKVKDTYSYNYNCFLNGKDKELDKYYSNAYKNNEYYEIRIASQNTKFLKQIQEYLDKNEKVLIVLDAENVFGDYGVMYKLGDKYEVSIGK